MKNILDAPKKKSPSKISYKKWAFYLLLCYLYLGFLFPILEWTSLISDPATFLKYKYVINLLKIGIVILGIVYLVLSHYYREKKDVQFYTALLCFLTVLLFGGIFSRLL